ncbi:MAG: hypothetical protein JEZ08_24755 [Clostridiales bacterium]|nr:hypothetical protein [Clostridiales bacterium]
MSSKKFLILVLFLLQCVILISCSDNQVNREYDLRIWSYEHAQDGTYDFYNEVVVNAIENYSQKHSLNVDFVVYTPETLSYDDYVLKRNIALETGEVDMILDTISGLMNIDGKATNYEVLSTSDDLVPEVLNSYAIPISYEPPLMLINNTIFESYEIEKTTIKSAYEWYQLKQIMKEKGAEFELNYFEMTQLIDYYLTQNDIYLKAEDNSITNELSEAVSMIIEDVETFYDPKIVNNKFFIYDKTIEKEVLIRKVDNTFENLSNLDLEKELSLFMDEDILYMRNRYGMLCFFIPRNYNEGIIGLADYLLSAEIQLKLCGGKDYRNGNLPINHNKSVLEELNISEDFSINDKTNIRNSNKVDAVLEEEFYYMRNTGIPKLLEKNNREFFLFGVYEILSTTLEKGYDLQYIESSTDKLLSDYQLYYLESDM